MKRNFVREITQLLDKVPAAQWKKPLVRGVCYDFMPWEELSTVTVQTADDDPHDLGGWKYYSSADSRCENLRAEVAKYVEGHDRLVYHGLLIEAAEAMLSIDYAKYGKPITVEDGFLYGPFQLQVYDADKTFRFNYCEYVLATRLGKAKPQKPKAR